MSDYNFSGSIDSDGNISGKIESYDGVGGGPAGVVFSIVLAIIIYVASIFDARKRGERSAVLHSFGGSRIHNFIDSACHRDKNRKFHDIPVEGDLQIFRLPDRFDYIDVLDFIYIGSRFHGGADGNRVRADVYNGIFGIQVL